MRRGFPATIALASMLFTAGSGPVGWAAQGSKPVNPHGSYEENCGLCHGDDGWKPVRISPKFKHAPKNFPLERAHKQTACRSCHVSIDFKAASPASECVSCHQDPHEGELGADCERCHSTRSFIDHGAMVRAHQSTRFPLVGAHAAGNCEGCHIGVPRGNLWYVNLSTDCESCHMAEYNATTNPPHQAAGFPPDCRLCHTPITWTATSNFAFNHGRTGFPLTGAHLNVPCTGCHVGGVFTGLNAACVSCHQDDYDGTTDPPHMASGFPTDCASCHNNTGWGGGKFNHDSLYFPIYSGAHDNKWSGCSTCHVNASNYSQFSCYAGCHEHADPTEVADHHRGVSGYNYDSQSCYSCHPRGNH